MKLLHNCLAIALVAIPCGAAQAAEDDGWKIGVDGGGTHYEGDKDPRFISLSLTREYQQGYVEVAISKVDGGATFGVLNPVATESEAITLAAGRRFGQWSFDAYASIGQRRFAPEPLPGRRLTINSDGSSFAIGGALAFDATLSDNLILSPFVALDYDKVDIGRAVVLPNGDVRTVKSSEKGVTGSAGLALQRLFGPDGHHAVGLNASLVATSNSSAARSGINSDGFSRVVAAQNGTGLSDEWAEIGAMTSFALTEKIRFNLNVSHTLGFTGPEATTLSAGLAFRF